MEHHDQRVFKRVVVRINAAHRWPTKTEKPPLRNQCCAADVASVKSIKKNAREDDVSVGVCLLFLFHFFFGDTPEGWGFDMEQGRAFSLPLCLRRVCAAGLQC